MAIAQLRYMLNVASCPAHVFQSIIVYNIIVLQAR